MSLVVLDPRKESGRIAVTPATRLSSLSNKRLGLLWNGRAGGDRILKHIAEHLKERYHLAAVHFIKKSYIGFPASPELIDEFVARTDAVIVGVGD
jgi:hypothetical protein